MTAAEELLDLRERLAAKVEEWRSIVRDEVDELRRQHPPGSWWPSADTQRLNALNTLLGEIEAVCALPGTGSREPGSIFEPVFAFGERWE